MRSPRRELGLALAAIVLAACSHAAAPRPAASDASGLLLDSRGIAMPLEKAVRLISFRPVVPGRTVAAVAVIPPLGNEDTPATRGIAFEYDDAGMPMLLSEWPAQHFRVAFGSADVSGRPCRPVPYSRNGVVWTTPRGLVMTLQPDGSLPRAALVRKARALIARGACR